MAAVAVCHAHAAHLVVAGVQVEADVAAVFRAGCGDGPGCGGGVGGVRGGDVAGGVVAHAVVGDGAVGDGRRGNHRHGGHGGAK